MNALKPDILFPNYPLRPREVDPDYRDEYEAALAVGFKCHLYSHEELLAGKGDRAVRLVDVRDSLTPCLMRGWMISEKQYALLDGALRQRGLALMNDSQAYAEAHYLPRAYPILQGLTPRSVWTDSADAEVAWRCYEQMRDRDAIVKDWVKSAKHRWDEACFIPAGSSKEHVIRVLNALAADRGRLFEHGYVFREFVPLQTERRDMRGHPISRETRLFYLDGQVLVRPRAEFLPPSETLERFEQAIRRFSSRFVTIDMAPTAAGDWIIIESGDAGVSGLPVSLLCEDFYGQLAERMRRDGC
jgi:hypothetical protein